MEKEARDDNNEKLLEIERLRECGITHSGERWVLYDTWQKIAVGYGKQP